MRIATSTIYSQQSASMDNLETQYQVEGNALSTGKTLNVPSDDPSQIAEDLGVHTTIALENTQATSIQAATAQMTSTDNALANLTSLMQTVQQVATGAATDLLTPTTRQNMATEVNQYLQQAVSIANTQYEGKYVFAGSADPTGPPITTTGSPISSVEFAGNEQTQTPLVINGQSFALSPTLQQAFNYDAPDGSPSVFQTLINLRDTLSNGTVTDESSTALNQAGSVIYGKTSPTPTTLGSSPSPFSVTPTADSSGAYTITINNTDAQGAEHVNTYTFYGTTAVDDTTALSITGEINAKNTGADPTGLTATFDEQTQRLVLTNSGGGAFTVTDADSTGATDTSNFTSLFKLQGTATLAQTISTQLGDISNTLSATLAGRAVLGTHMDALSQINSQISVDIVDNTSVQSGIEDTDIAKMATQFTATQTALTASYSTTTRLEAKDLFDYL